MREDKKAIRWKLQIGDTEFAIIEFTIFDKEGGRFNLTYGDSRIVIDAYRTPEEAAVALARLSVDPEWSRTFKGNIVPGELSAWTPEPRGKEPDQK